MNRLIPTGLVFVLALAVGLSLLGNRAGADDDAGAGLTWRTDLDAARAEARASGRPLFLVFRCKP